MRRFVLLLFRKYGDTLQLRGKIWYNLVKLLKKEKSSESIYC